MAQNDKLFILIKSLNKNEKGYFKKVTRKHIQGDGNKYLKLFDAIDQQTHVRNGQEKYNEEKLLKKFVNEKFSKQIHVIKNYLFNAIFKSLQDYHHNTSAESTLKNSLRNVEIAYKKGLFEFCTDLLIKAKKVAIESELYPILFEIIEWQRRILDGHGDEDLDKNEKTLNELKLEEAKYYKIYENSREYQFFEHKILLIQKKNRDSPTKESLKSIEELAKNPLLKNEKNALSIKAKAWYNRFYANFYSHKKKYLASINFSKRSVELIECHSEIWRDPSTLLNAIYELGVMTYEQKLYRETLSAIHKMKIIEGRNNDFLRLKYLYTYSLEIVTYNDIGDFQQVANLAPVIYKWLNEYDKKIGQSSQIHFCLEISFAFFGVGDYKMALKWLNKVLNRKHRNERELLVDAAKTLNLLVHYEIGNYDLLESLIKSTKRSFEKTKSQFYIEILFTESLNQIIHGKSNKDIVVILKDFKGQVKKIKKKDSDTISTKIYDPIISPWLESKIQKKSFAEIVREKAKPFLK